MVVRVWLVLLLLPRFNKGQLVVDDDGWEVMVNLYSCLKQVLTQKAKISWCQSALGHRGKLCVKRMRHVRPRYIFDHLEWFAHHLREGIVPGNRRP